MVLLVADVVLPRLPPGAPGHALWEHHLEIDSTNTRASELARQGAPHGTVVVAEHQRAGKGRRGRTFVSPPGTGIYLSVVLRPPLRPPDAWRLTFCGALAVMDACVDVGVDARLKWPNDVFVGGRKVCGVLTELSADMTRIHQAIVGIGVNVNTPAAAWPDDVRSIATSVAASVGQDVDRVAFAATLLARLGAWYTVALENPAALLAHVRRTTITLGRTVRVVDGEQVLHGVAEALDDDGALRVRTADGIRRVVAGDVELAVDNGGGGGGRQRGG